MKNAFYPMLEALFIFKIFTSLSWLFGHVEKRLDKKTWIKFKLYDITDCQTNNYNTYIAR